MSAPTWAVQADRRAPFLSLVRVELGKVAGTRSDKILLVISLPTAVGLLLIGLTTDNAVSGASQLLPVVRTLPIGQLLVMSAVIKLVSGEWHHRSVQPTLLAQPSRLRYLTAQAVVVGVLVGVLTVVQAVAGLLVQQHVVHRVDAQDIVAARPAWALGVVVLTAALSTAMGYAVALLIPNTPTALTVYLAATIVLLFVRGGLPGIDQWFDPVGLASWWAGSPGLSSPLPSLVALSLLAVSLVAGVRAVRRRDAA